MSMVLQYAAGTLQEVAAVAPFLVSDRCNCVIAADLVKWRHLQESRLS
ncbi:MAG TPA: hypothetical protein VKH15_07530 [Candidatus Acidoferrum sp.]|nr:hypothetical protein [Candidatus Acidoferrum sp.]